MCGYDKNMNSTNKQKIESRIKELEDIAKVRHFDRIDSPADFLMEYLTPEEYEEWSNLLDRLV